ncbi:uncharacterized protein MYCGRDRAFT_51365 [Zymoseptoria tritici IPO323]|uniref:Uncharacterized protein n=1 Tax=Zymoseptoria tritici (strain CBS 115943 / IPO323) TaxID=336722 RepID=F9XPL2_ZYMTI|nr:uncharacterized protein MYCGRDRAFT_51365 [Zymoseptoria tritici IPO323]EGP82811.1 hypothetical protein MYCGRDRAFT_51365 [Zymoseptoria tritici IPO323]
MSTVNIVKFYFHARHIPGSEARMRQLIALAYQTARDKQLYPKAVFIRYDPMGDHVTFSYKTQDNLGQDTHVACHGYVHDPETLQFKKATHAAEKPDSTKKGNKKPVWPDDEDLWEAPDVGYGHLP